MSKGFNVAMIAASGSDEYYTPGYAVAPILPYIIPESVVWCPFDTEQSVFVQMLREAGHAVVATHLFTGGDFFTIKPPAGCNYIVSNPPYSVKGQVFEHLFNLKIPFAMLVSIVGLFENKQRFDMFKSNAFEVMYLSGRVAYFKDYTEQKPSISPPFSSGYVCSGILPQQIVFAEIVKPKRPHKGAATMKGGAL